MGKEKGKPRGRMSSYAFFVQTCREEHKKKHPGETVVFGEFAKKCSEKWKSMSAKEKKRFEDMAAKDKTRYDREMANYTPAAGETGRKRKRTKDPNAPKRNLSAFFFFCADERPNVRKSHPGWTVGDVAKELGKRWEDVKDKTRFEQLAEKDKSRYEKDMAAYRSGASPKKAPVSPPKKVRQEVEEDDDDEDEEEDEEEEEEDDDDDDE